MPDDNCTKCDHALDSYEEIKAQGLIVEPDSTAVCAYCGHTMGFDENHKLRNLVESEFKQRMSDINLTSLQNDRQNFKSWLIKNNMP